MIGLVPKFNFIATGWYPEYIKTQMKHSRAIEGIDIPWMGYFFLGGREKSGDSCLSRFNPGSPFYQAWFGVYLMKGDPFDGLNAPFGFNRGYPDFHQLVLAGIGDQHSWLLKYAIEDPICRPIEIGAQDPALFSIRNKTGYIWTGSFLSRSDISHKGSVDWRYNKLFGKPPESYFSLVPEHHMLLLEGFYVCGYEKTGVTWIVYGVASKFETKQGILVSNYPILKAEMIAMAAQVELEPVTP